MKKMLLFALLAIAFTACKMEQGTYEISGNVAGLEGNVVMLDEYGNQIAESETSGGKFSFSGKVEETTPVLLSDGSEPFAVIFLETGKIKVSGNIAEGGIKATGTASNDSSTRYDNDFQAIVERVTASQEPDVDAFMAESRKFAEDAVDKNLDNFFGIYMLSEVAAQWEADRVIEKLDEFPEELRQNSYAQKLRETTLKRKRTDMGQAYMNITLPDPAGSETSLGNYIGEGKYVLIDFWASWCGPCMAELPYLKSVYEKYHPKGFEIYGVSLDMDKETWLNALQKNEMEWPNVFHGPATNGAEDSANSILSDYSITVIPTNFLIGPDGTIVAKNLRGEELEKFIGEQLQ